MEEPSKRKRVSDSKDQPAAKRLAAQTHQTSPGDIRAAIAEVYHAYDALNRNNGGDDGQEHFLILLKAAQGR